MLLLYALPPLAAQEQADTSCFVAGNDMSYLSGNDKELARMEACVEQLKEGIFAREIPVLVDGYCTYFVTVRLTIPAKETAVSDAEAEARRKAEAEKADRQNTITDTSSETKAPAGHHLFLRANLLRWATLTPDLGIEWRISPSWGIAVNGSWMSWSWSDKERRYALWAVAPEVRWYPGERKDWYVGAMFKAGQFNYKFSETGRQGDLMGGGITGGYQLRLNKALALDLNLGLGYLNADGEKYEVIDGVRVRRGSETKDWWGPINAGVTLVWKLF